MRKFTRLTSTLLFITVSVLDAASVLAKDEKAPNPAAKSTAFCDSVVNELTTKGFEDARQEVDQLILRSDQSNVESILKKRYKMDDRRARINSDCINAAHFRRNSRKSNDDIVGDFAKPTMPAPPAPPPEGPPINYPNTDNGVRDAEGNFIKWEGPLTTPPPPKSP